MSDKIQESAKQTAPASNEHLLADFLSAHKTSGVKSEQDIKDNTAAQKTDRDTIKLLGKTPLNASEVVKALKEDEKQDKAAAGTGRADDANAKLDDKIVTLDKKFKAANEDKLDPSQKELIDKDMMNHSKDADYSRKDKVDEKAYIKHDQGLLSSIESGKGIDKGATVVTEDRQKDIKKEGQYIANDREMSKTNKDVLKMFGDFQVR